MCINDRILQTEHIAVIQNNLSKFYDMINDVRTIFSIERLSRCITMLKNSEKLSNKTL